MKRTRMVESEEEENNRRVQLANRDSTLPVCPFSVRCNLIDCQCQLPCHRISRSTKNAFSVMTYV